MALILVRNANRAVCGVYTHGWRWERALEQGRKRVRWKEGPSPTSSAITCKGTDYMRQLTLVLGGSGQQGTCPSMLFSNLPMAMLKRSLPALLIG
jgi:hypothetical protein